MQATQSFLFQVTVWWYLSLTEGSYIFLFITFTHRVSTLRGETTGHVMDGRGHEILSRAEYVIFDYQKTADIHR